MATRNIRANTGYYRRRRINCARNNHESHSAIPHWLIIGSAILLTLLVAAPAAAAPDSCEVDGSTVTCTGDQSDGIAVHGSGGQNITVNGGTADEMINVNTAGTSGISVTSTGQPSHPQVDPFLGIPIPGRPEVAGGVVAVNTHANITTSGDGAHGIYAGSATTGYPDSVEDDLNAFLDQYNSDGAGLSFTVFAVGAADNTDGIGDAIAGQLQYFVPQLPCDPVADPQCRLDETARQAISGTGGEFTIDEQGNFAFDPLDDFDDLAVGESRIVSIDYWLNGDRNGSAYDGIAATLIARVAMTDNGLEITYQTVFNDPNYDFGDRPVESGIDSVFPDVGDYVQRLIDSASHGGSGNSVTINHLAGDIITGGTGAHGIFGESHGVNGARGRNGGGFFTFGARPPRSGGDGSDGGQVTINADGSITTSGDNAIGIFGFARGGHGGTGGDGGTWYGGRTGGRGGTGGDVLITGTATITTSGANAVGVMAFSQGGYGGLGGDGGFAAGGARGGYGGEAGTVVVDGNFDITTTGDSAHGIWAKSMGGNAGAGGSGGWLAGAAAGGGEGAVGGTVIISNAGQVVTYGSDAFGLYAQSIGGFGGAGGYGGSIFASRGGDGNSAGSGGDVSITNLADGIVITYGTSSHALFAQSVGGGGGSGGLGAGVIYGIGGTGGAGGHGGDVLIENFGLIETWGLNSRGVFAQSIGGGGGDGGAGGGIVGIGGSAGGGSDGGLVTVINANQVVTHGDSSDAIYAQSIGGGGGSGGPAGGFVAIGGSGGGGGNAGDVKVTNDGIIGTEGARSRGIFAQSVGGGGGDGGGTGGWFASLGGSGAMGGFGGRVDVINNGAIITTGDWSHSIFAQSVGGGGGTGGGSGGVWVAIGGSGGSGNDGGDIKVTNNGLLSTTGLGARGIIAQSVGGGGGNGGGSGALNIAIGGAGGGGGIGGRVDVINNGMILTTGDLAQAIFAQSVGGSGGNGGNTGSMFVTVGGGGGAGNDGGIVNVLNSGLINTLGNNAAGIFAQSVGGSGGNGGNATSVQIAGPLSLTVAVGGNGGEGGDGGDVTVTNTGGIYTEGANSDAVFAQSVGGGGGSGGSATTASLAFPVEIEGVEIPAITLNVAVGGQGGGGGAAGTVDVTNQGDIMTTGFMANGIFAQSVGGSGGRGGNATNIQIAYDALFSGTVAVGGSGGDGNAGNTVTVNNSGTIWTKGHWSNGVFAQSVGGGGGIGGDATTVAISLTPPPTSPTDFIPTPDMSFDLAIGGDGGNGAVGGFVEVTNSGTVITEGDFSAGVMAQSVGGAGGAGGDARVIQVDLSADPMDFISLLDLMSLDVTLVFGGTGGDGGDGGDVVVTNEGGVKTSGAFSHGIVAQSVGGGGGSGGSAATFEFSNTELPVEIPILDDIAGLTTIEMTFQGSGGAGGDGGDVTLNSNGVILTEGEFAMGVVGQSVAGGGGLAGFFNPHGIINNEVGDALFNAIIDTDAGMSFAGSVGGAGDAGSVEINHAGTIQTLGTGAHGIFAQSAAGQGTAGTVDVTLDGSIYALGNHAYGIFAQSGGASGNGDITLTLGDGIVMGGTGMGSGLFIAGGADNEVFNSSTVTSVDGIHGYAIRAMGGDEFIENNGVLIGSVDLGGGINHVANYGLINAGSIYDLGTGNLLLNAGDFAPGGVSNVFMTQVNGDFTQSAAGTLWFDLVFDFGLDTWDYLDISGISALDGTIKLLLHDTHSVMPGEWQAILISSEGGISEFGLDLDVPDSAVINYALKAASETDYMLHYLVDFAPMGLTRNQAAMGEHFNDIQLAGSTEMMKPLTTSIVAIPDVGTLGGAYDLLSPHVYSANQLSRLFSALDFENSLHSCSVRDGDFRFSREGNCTWMRVSDRDMEFEGRHELPMATDYATIVNLGMQRTLSRHWHGGIGFGFEKSEYEIRDLADRDGSQLQVGGIVKGRYGGNAVDLSMTMGRGSYDTRRTITDSNHGNYTMTERDISFVSAHAGYAYSFEGERWFFRPGLDIGWTDVSGDRVDEAGGGPTALHIKGTDDDYVTSRLDLRLGSEFSTRNDTLYRPFLRTAYTHIHSGTRNEIHARLAGAPDSVPNFTQVLFVDDNYTSVSLGLDILARRNWIMSFAYDRQFADRWDADSFFAKIMFEM